MSELIPVANTDQAGRVGDVVFVHGLGGNPREYWMADKDKPETFWPAWLGEDVPGVGVWSLGYDAAKFKWQGSPMPLYDRAQHALALLDTDGIGEWPIVFVTHSMGGLLVKQMIRNGLSEGYPPGRRSPLRPRGSASSPRRIPGQILPITSSSWRASLRRFPLTT